MSGESCPAQLCRRHNIPLGLLYHWQKRYSLRKFNNETIEEATLKDRIEKLEHHVGRITLENEFLKRGCTTISASLGITGSHPPLTLSHRQHPERMPADEYLPGHVLLPEPGAVARERADPTDRIKAICQEFRGYGYRRVTK